MAKLRCSVKLHRSRMARIKHLMSMKSRKGTGRKRTSILKKLRKQIAACAKR